MNQVRLIHPGIYVSLWLLPVLALLQTSTVNHLQVAGVLPSIVLIVVIDWGILRGPEEGMLWAFIGGLCTDMFSSWPLGTSTVAMVTVASLVSLGGGTFIRTHFLLPLGTVFLATILYYAVAMFLLISTHHPVAWVQGMRYLVLPIAAYNSLLNIVGFRLVRRLEQRIYPLPRANW